MTQTAAGQVSEHAGAPDHRRGTIILFTLLSAGLVFSMVQTSVAPALPAIAEAYNAAPGDTAWVLARSCWLHR